MMAKVMHFFENTKLFCHFLLPYIEKVLYFYMIQVSQVQKLKKLKELSLPTVAKELRQ